MKTPRKTIAIIQARMGSSRLPGKVLLDIQGQPMLAHVVERASRAQTVDQVVVATTTEPGDDPVEALCASRGFACYRGSLHDVLDRYYGASRTFEAQVIVRVTGDCPLIDPGLIDETVRAFWGLSGDQNDFPPQPVYDFAANRLPPPWERTYPIGLDTEVCTFEGLALAWQEASLPHQREHVMPFFYEQPERFRILRLDYPVNYGSLRWTVDTPEDLALVRQVLVHFAGRDDFTWLDVLELFQREPALGQINTGVHHKDYREVDGRSTHLKEG